MSENKLGWNSNFEKIILNFKNKISSLGKQHSELSEIKYKYHSYYMLSVLIIGPLTGLVSGVGSYFKTHENLLLVSSSFLNIFSGIILSIIKFNKYDEISNDHKNAAIRYASLEHNIEQQILLRKKDRIEAEKYLDFLNEEFRQICASSPFINCYIEDKEDEEEYEDDSDLGNSESDLEEENKKLTTKKDGILQYELERFNTKKNI